MNPSIPSVRWRTLKIIGAALLLALLSACSAIKLAYNNGHEVAWWWLTDYVDVQGEDKATLRQAVHQLHEWHRRDQLPSYVELLRSWQGQMSGELSGEQVCRMVDDAMQRATALAGAVQVLEPPALQVLARLNARQIAEMERQFAKSNRKFREKYVDITPRELLDNRVESGMGRAERLYGSLGRPQEQALRSAMMAAPWDTREAYEWRLRRQQDIVQTLRQLTQSQASTDQTRAALRSLLLRQIDPQEPTERSRMLGLRKQSCQVLAQLHASTTPAQRAKAQDTLRGYATDLASLVPGR